jgi:N-acetylmuramoyl-L-alanine amidase
MELAGKLSLAMSEALSLPMRHRNGIKEISKGERGWYNVAQTLSVPSVLIESGFADNPIDSASMQKNKGALAGALVDTFIKWV